MTKPNLDNITQAFIDEIENRGGKPLYDITPDEARHFLYQFTTGISFKY